MRLIIYSKPGCHLCEEMKATVARLITSYQGVSLEEIDISAEPELLDRYGLEIPVLLIDGKKVAKYRITEAELRKLIASRQSKVDSDQS